MSLSDDAKRRLVVALASADAGEEVALAIESPSGSPAADVPAIGATTNLPAAACAGTTAPSATNVNAAIDTVSAVVESRLDTAESKINAILSSLKTAGLMA
jgi:hypothetical protein